MSDPIGVRHKPVLARFAGRIAFATHPPKLYPSRMRDGLAAGPSSRPTAGCYDISRLSIIVATR